MELLCSEHELSRARSAPTGATPPTVHTASAAATRTVRRLASAEAPPASCCVGRRAWQVAWDALPSPALAGVLEHLLAQCSSPEGLGLERGGGDSDARATCGVFRRVRCFFTAFA